MNDNLDDDETIDVEDTATETTSEDSGERCFVIHPNIKSRTVHARSPEAYLDEICGLAEAIDLDIVASEVVTLGKLKPGTYFGKGTCERLGTVIKSKDVAVAIVDTHLSPIQQRNLEKAWDCKVLDRTGIILEIFGERARTKEGVLQVELAHMIYQRSRLVRSWTHLERQRGGAGFMGGPGETQIEVDRRLIDLRIVKLKKQLNEVKRTRELHRSQRRKVDTPIVALVGYTNAGKSTLFNLLSNSDVFVKDQLFATLDPTMRGIQLPNGRDIILSDTVGFISDLPHELVDSFHATLEEVLEAQVVVHVRDIAHPDTEAQHLDVQEVLLELGLDDAALQSSLIEVRNKVDVLNDEDRELQINQAGRADHPVVVMSAATGFGVDAFLKTIEDRLGDALQTVNVTLNVADGKTLAWLYSHGEVLNRVDEGNSIHLTVRFDAANFQRYQLINP